MAHRTKRTFEDYEPDELAHLCADPVFGLICRYCGNVASANSPRGSFFPEKSSLEAVYNPELMEDPDNRPYIWDIPEGDCKCH